MKTSESKLLQLILAETIRVEGLSLNWDDYGHGRGDNSWPDAQQAREELPEFGVRVVGSWLGDDAAGRQRRRRCLLALVTAGLVELSAARWDERRTTHVKLTAAGRAEADRITRASSSKTQGTSGPI